MSSSSSPAVAPAFGCRPQSPALRAGRSQPVRRTRHIAGAICSLSERRAVSPYLDLELGEAAQDVLVLLLQARHLPVQLLVDLVAHRRTAALHLPPMRSMSARRTHNSGLPPAAGAHLDRRWLDARLDLGHLRAVVPARPRFSASTSALTVHVRLSPLRRGGEERASKASERESKQAGAVGPRSRVAASRRARACHVVSRGRVTWPYHVIASRDVVTCSCRARKRSTD